MTFNQAEPCLLGTITASPHRRDSPSHLACGTTASRCGSRVSRQNRAMRPPCKACE